MPPGFREDHKDNETLSGLAVRCEREGCVYKSRHSPYIPEMFPLTWQVEWFIRTSMARKCEQRYHEYCYAVIKDSQCFTRYLDFIENSAVYVYVPWGLW